MTGKLLCCALIGYALFCLAMYFGQRHLLYLPDTTRLTPYQVRLLGLRAWPSEDHFCGFRGVEEPASAQGTIVVFHGNAGAASDRGMYLHALRRQGLRVILAEYPGYGGRPGAPAENLLVRDALETLRTAYQHFGAPLYVWGESMGCGVAAAAIAQTEVPVQGLVLMLPWDSLPDLAQTHYWYLPARWLVRDSFDSVANLMHFQGKTAVLLAGDDEVIPVRHGRRLYEALGAEKKLWVFPGVRHNEIPMTPDLLWWREVVGFIAAPPRSLEVR